VNGAAAVKQEATSLVHTVCGDGVNPGIMPMEKLRVPVESEKPRIRGFSDEW
jgi:hypothetical protein